MRKAGGFLASMATKVSVTSHQPTGCPYPNHPQTIKRKGKGMKKLPSEQIFDLTEQLTAARAAVKGLSEAIQKRIDAEKRFDESDVNDSYLQSYIREDFQRARDMMRQTLTTHAAAIKDASNG